MTDVSRRSFLAGGLGFWTLGLTRSPSARFRQSPFGDSPFTLGVASGDPSAGGVVLWTRLAPDPLNGGGMDPAPVRVRWEIARDDGMKNIVRRGTAVASTEWAHSVHVEVDGLEPDRWYWYRFHAGSEESPVGRTRTLPSPTSRPDRFRFGFASCQNYEHGYFTALKHAAEDDIDLMFHLGDFIYEHAALQGRPRQHLSDRLTTLPLYRNRLAQYRMDPDLQASHAAFPWIVTWDDHEVADNYAAERGERVDPAGEFLERRAAAYQAYYEHMPLRRRALPRGPYARIYRQFVCGSLASFFVLDTRQYRSHQPCGGGVRESCPDTRQLGASMLGDNQERWLLSGLTQSRRRWNVLPQQVMMAKVDLTPGPPERISMDQWSGYDVARTRLLEFFAAHRTLNPVVLSGDIHNNWVNDLKVDFRDPRSPTVGTELVGTSVTSGGDGSDLPDNMRPILADNPFVRFFNSQRGYVRCEVTPEAFRADYRVVPYVERPGAPITTRASFLVQNGHPGAQRL